METLLGLTASGTTVSGRFSVLVISRDTGTLRGVNVVLPIGPAKKVCFRCVLASATILGVSDSDALHTEACWKDFPFDSPELWPKTPSHLRRHILRYCNTRNTASLSALCCRSSPFLAMRLPSLLSRPSAIAEALFVPRLRRGALPRCGGSHRSAIAAVSPDGGSNWMAEQLGPL